MDGDNYQQIGWWIWNIVNPNSKLFSTEALTAENHKDGYRSQPVYVNTREEP